MGPKDDTKEHGTETGVTDSLAVGRRTLLRAVGASGAAAAMADPVGAESVRGVFTSETDETALDDSEDLPPGTEGLLAYVDANYGDQLSEDQLEQVEQDIAANLRAAAAVEEVPLDYTTGPAFTFTAYRGDDDRDTEDEDDD